MSAASRVMKWTEIVRFEWTHQLTRWPNWILLGLFLFPLVGVTLDQLAAAGRADLPFHAPLLVAQSGSIMGVVALLILAGVAGDAATRDVRTRLEPLVRAAPVTRTTYLGGRFFGAFLFAAAIMAVVPLTRIGVGMVQPALPGGMGPLRVAAYLQTYCLVLLPNAAIAMALMFALATVVRHSLGAWLGAALLFLGGQLSHAYLGDSLGRWDLATLLDPTGITALDLMSRTWTPIESSTRMIALEPSLLWNRLLWIGIVGVVLLFVFRRSDSTGRAGRLGWWKRSRTSAATTPRPLTPPMSAPLFPREFGLRGRVAQTLSITRDSLREIAPRWTWPAPVLLLLGQSSLTLEALGSMGAGTPVQPTTGLVLRTLGLGGSAPPPVALAAILFPIVLAGELIWRERDTNLHPLTDAAPAPDGVRFLGKLLALWSVIATLFLAMALGGLLAQVRLGGAEVEPLVYLLAVGLQLVGPLLFALLALSVHVVVNQKRLAHVVALFIVAPVLPQLLRLEHPLLLIGSEPEWRHSAISGFGPLGPLLWFNLYWTAWAILAALVARLFWVRGAEQGLGERWSIARIRAAGSKPQLALGLAAVLLTGGAIFYNTNVLNAYRTSTQTVIHQANYERLYGRFKGVDQPTLTATELHAELHPDRGEAEVRGVHVLVNKTALPMDTVHVATSELVETTHLGFDRSARSAALDDDLGHRIYVLNEALEPGDTLRMEWQVRHQPRGFSARGVNAAVVGNGSFFVAAEWVPLIGYQLNRQLRSPTDRRAHALPEWSPVPVLDSTAIHDRYGMDQLNLTATVGTPDDQTGVAAGGLVGTWTEAGRRYSHYETNAPIGNGYAIFSADYAVSRSSWRGGTESLTPEDGALAAGTPANPTAPESVAIEVFHRPDHDANVPRMIRGIEASLAQLTERFGAFPYDVIRMVEYPGAGGSLHAASATIWYQEMFSFFDVERDPRNIDMVFAVTAHEVAHQFQPVPARMEGRALLSESFAWYAALGVIEEEYGTAHLGRFLDFMRRSYLTPRSRASVPLLRANDAFLGYRKGPFAMYALREYLGQDRVDRAWRRLRERHASHEPPFATSLDLYRELRAVTPDSLQTLLADLIERNTYWELSAQRATREQTPSGDWRVVLEIEARKVAVDEMGNEAVREMDDLIEIGVYATGADGVAGEPLYLAGHRIRSGRQTIVLTVPDRPDRARIDPRRLLIDVRADDNEIPVGDFGGASASAGTPSPPTGRN